MLSEKRIQEEYAKLGPIRYVSPANEQQHEPGGKSDSLEDLDREYSPIIYPPVNI